MRPFQVHSGFPAVWTLDKLSHRAKGQQQLCESYRATDLWFMLPVSGYYITAYRLDQEV